MKRINNIDKTLIFLLAVMFMSFLTFTAIVITGDYYIGVFYVLSNGFICLAFLSIIDELIETRKINKDLIKENKDAESEVKEHEENN